MKKNSLLYKTYLAILQEELVPAMGCTEPICIAYCAAKAKEVLEKEPERVVIEVSGNIIKNVKSVIVPNTNGLKGIEASAAVGIIAGDASKVLEVISKVSEKEKLQTARYLQETDIVVKPARSEEQLDVKIHVYAKGEEASVRIAGFHTNIVQITKNGEILFEAGMISAKKVELTDRSMLNVQGIYEFAETVNIEDIENLLERQITYNMAIAKEGMKNPYGANIGKVIAKMDADTVKNKARAYASAGSDARMSGCEMPVIINSGSGNQGMTSSIPVIVYAEEYKKEKEKLYRALVLSNLITIHQKTGIGRLSAYCGAVSAGCGAGCGIAYLLGCDYKTITHTLVNALGIVSGIVCDGAKPSCAGKIAAAIDAGIMGYEMYCCGQQFYGGDGIISKGVENTINNIGRLGKIGMAETDQEIIRIMTEC